MRWKESKITYVDSGKPVVDENGKRNRNLRSKENYSQEAYQPDTAAIIFHLDKW